LLKNKYIFIRYSNGVGNNIFQYNFCFALISNKNEIKIINPLKLDKKMYNLRNRLIGSFLFLLNRFMGKHFKSICIIDNNTRQIPDSNLLLFQDTGEVINMFEGNEKVITKNFFKLNSFLTNINYAKDNKKVIVLHLRLGDRLLRKSDYERGMFYDFDKLQLIINKEKQNSNNLVSIFVVTDSPKIMNIKNELDIDLVNSHISVANRDRVDKRVAISYIKRIQDFIIFNKVNIFDSQFLYQDFNMMLNADVLILLHGTLSWWAGYLGKQSKVYVSGTWRPSKSNNPLLSKYNSDKWLKW
tara:strand:- start:2074 stop:2970 length:897 start_codon:yes stop_codon:yes gene_type:complete